MIKRTIVIFFSLFIACHPSLGQAARRSTDRGASVASRPCSLKGSYRIDVENSDKLYSAVRGATGRVPFEEQQQFFMDLSVRLTPPDLLAVECDGQRVSVASSRAAKVTFLADGRLRQERFPDGTVVRSRITMGPETLTFVSTGKAEDNLNVVFRSLDRGRKLEVTRRIDADQLAQPIVIRSVYNRLSNDVDWDVFNGRLVAGRGDNEHDRPDDSAARASNDRVAARTADLRTALQDWIHATNRRDIERQMAFYLPRMQAFYLTRNTSREAVRAEKNRAFRTARSIDITADEPEIVLQNNGRTAVMRFRKSYRIVDRDRARTRSGVVIQELRWQRTADGWRISSERDIRVIR